MNGSDIFSCSTSWNSGRHTNGREMIEEIKSLGFKKVELCYHVTEKMAQEILPMVQKGEIEVTSIHNVFPEIYDEDYGTDSVLLGYTDREKREKSIQYTIGTVDYAARFGAKAVVIHAGEVPVTKEYNKTLETLFAQGKKDTPEFAALFREMLDYREENSPRYVKLIGDSLETICEHIEKKGYKIALGLENRTRCHQIPVFHETHTLLEHLKGLPVYPWYDVGHGVLMGQLGMFDNIKEATALKDRFLGIHMHSVDVVRDHQCPFILNDDFNKYMHIVKSVPIKVLELSASCKKEDIMESLRLLTEAISRS